MEATQKRAYSDDQKAMRREAILSSAKDLFQTRRFEDVKMLDIAKHCGVSKGSLYFYFASKEALFLQYAKQEIDVFFDRLFVELCRREGDSSVPAVVNAISDAYAGQSALMRLLSLLHSVLESKVDYDSALAFRRSLLPLLHKVGFQMERHLSFLDPNEGAKLLLTIHAMALGFQQLADPSPVLLEVEKQADMNVYVFEFEEAFIGALRQLLRGMQVERAS